MYTIKSMKRDTYYIIYLELDKKDYYTEDPDNRITECYRINGEWYSKTSFGRSLGRIPIEPSAELEKEFNNTKNLVHEQLPLL